MEEQGQTWPMTFDVWKEEEEEKSKEREVGVELRKGRPLGTLCGRCRGSLASPTHAVLSSWFVCQWD